MKNTDNLKVDGSIDSSDKNENSSFENSELESSGNVSDKGTPPQGPTPRVVPALDETV